VGGEKGHTPVTPPITIDSSTAVINQDPGMQTGGDYNQIAGNNIS
jgi:hypothetical protein